MVWLCFFSSFLVSFIRIVVCLVYWYNTYLLVAPFGSGE